MLIVNYAIPAQKNKSFGQIVTAISKERGDYDLYFMTDKKDRLIVDSILIHCNKYKEHEVISSSYILKSWKYAMQGATMWCFSDCSLDSALEGPRRLALEHEIKTINDKYKEE